MEVTGGGWRHRWRHKKRNFSLPCPNNQNLCTQSCPNIVIQHEHCYTTLTLTLLYIPNTVPTNRSDQTNIWAGCKIYVLSAFIMMKMRMMIMRMIMMMKDDLCMVKMGGSDDCDNNNRGRLPSWQGLPLSLWWIDIIFVFALICSHIAVKNIIKWLGLCCWCHR